ncbi:MAG: Crp/Fnr family transcriptional regulator, partial [Sphingobacteriales bacterium]
MLKSLLAYINEYSNLVLSPSETELINSSFQVKKLKKKEIFLRTGDVSRYCGFIVKGSMRTYKVCDKGMEHAVKLAVENYWIGDLGSFSSQKPSSYNIDAREPHILDSGTCSPIIHSHFYSTYRFVKKIMVGTTSFNNDVIKFVHTTSIEASPTK